MSEDKETLGRVLFCPQCKKYVSWTFKENIVAFCDDVCLNSFVCEESAESKDEMLAALDYANNREDLT
jgi:endogenous inhibitor of DNA gyrase (YacG/DUF329 family)